MKISAAYGNIEEVMTDMEGTIRSMLWEGKLCFVKNAGHQWERAAGFV